MDNRTKGQSYGAPRTVETMELSARNQPRGAVKSVRLGTIMAEVVVDVAEQEVVSAITRSSVERMNVQEGDNVVVVIKSTEVMLAKE
jgi:molybdopterin-binding protein